MQAMAQVWAHPEDLPLYPVSSRHCSTAVRAASGLRLPFQDDPSSLCSSFCSHMVVAMADGVC